MRKISVKELAKLIDLTMLKPTTTKKDVENLCREARKYGFTSVCISPAYVALARRLLKGTDIKVCTVIGFPLGASTLEAKVFEAKNAIENGAQELDIVMNIGAFKSGDYDLVKEELREIVNIAREKGVVVKVIIETCYLTNEEKVKACLIAKEIGVDFVKTSTGFGPSGATVHDVELMRKIVGKEMGVKAAGGIRTLRDALAMLEAGANRIGTSSGIAIVREAEKESRN